MTQYNSTVLHGFGRGGGLGGRGPWCYQHLPTFPPIHQNLTIVICSLTHYLNNLFCNSIASVTENKVTFPRQFNCDLK